MKSLKPYNTYNTQAYAKHVYFPQSIDEISKITRKHRRYCILGNGSNIILSKERYDDIAFIILRDLFSKIEKKDNTLTAQSGAKLKTLSQLAQDHELSGLETFYDIPASVGGSLVMNAGAYGDQIYDIVESVTYLDLDNHQVENT